MEVDEKTRPVATVAEANIILLPPEGPSQYWYREDELPLEEAYKLAGIDKGCIEHMECGCECPIYQETWYRRDPKRRTWMETDISQLDPRLSRVVSFAFS